MSESNTANWLLVLVRTDDGKGSATVMCKAMDEDPMFPDKVVLRDIVGFFWPAGQHHVQVQLWSIPKSVVLNWMVGTLQGGPPITAGTMAGEQKTVPQLPGVSPNIPLTTPAEITALVEAQIAAAAPPSPEPLPKDPEPPKDPPSPKVQKSTTRKRGRRS